MAVNLQTTWADTTEVLVTGVRTMLKAVEVEVDPASTAAVYVQLFNEAGVTPGTTAPSIVLLVPFVTQMNRRKVKYVFAGGIVFDTALEWFVSTTHDGATAPTGVNLPEVSRLYYEPMTD
jgi:hypothetical protein